MSMTTIWIAAEDRDALKADAEAYGQDLVVFVPALRDLWRAASEDQRMELIKAANQRHNKRRERAKRINRKGN